MNPLIGITLGDPAGIGPEITVKALADHPVSEKCRPLVIGDACVLENAVKITNRPVSIHVIEKPSEGFYRPGCIDVIDMKAVDMEKLQIGQVSAMAGEAAFQYVKKVIELAMAGEVDATVTNALNKEAVNLAGRHYSGHTEIYAEFTGTDKYTMMLAHKNLRVVHVSTHVSLREACDRFSQNRSYFISGHVILWETCLQGYGDRESTDWRSRVESPQRRKRIVRQRRDRGDQTGSGAGSGGGYKCRRSDSGGHGIFQGQRRLVRYCSSYVSRSGAHPVKSRRICLQPAGEEVGRRGRCEYHTGTADYQDQRRSRHSF